MLILSPKIKLRELGERREEFFSHKETQRKRFLDRINGIYRIKQNPVNRVNPVPKNKRRELGERRDVLFSHEGHKAYRKRQKQVGIPTAP